MKRQSCDPPKRTAWLYNGFVWYCGRMVRKRFEAMAVDENIYKQSVVANDTPVIIYANHASWWDPILAVLLHEHLFKQRAFYAPIDEVALKKYDVLSKLGFYPIALDSFSGAADFLRCSKTILDSKQAAIWLTPEGRFADARDHSAPLMPGLAHLFKSADRIVAIPLAIEYVFWNEAKPYMLMRLGAPIDSKDSRQRSKQEIGVDLTKKLRECQRDLKQCVTERRIEPFSIIHQASSGPKSLYDFARALKSIVHRKPVQLRHDS